MNVSGAVEHGARSAIEARDLARRGDFHLAAGTVRPSVRTVEGPGGTLSTEPRVMQVLVALADASGGVVSREDLIRDCWAGRIVGDDAINRVIGELRRIGRESGAGYSIETIPKIGYRLAETALPIGQEAQPAAGEASGPGKFRRRGILAGGAIAMLAAGGGLWWSLSRTNRSPAAALIDEGELMLREAWPGDLERTVTVLRQAVEAEPDNARAWGLLALAWRDAAEGAEPDRISAAVNASEQAARRALSLDPREGNAMAALATLQPFFGDWGPAEERLRKVLAVAPDNLAAVLHLVTLLQSVGRARASREYNDRAIRLQPLSPLLQFRAALKHWIFGEVGQADLTIDRALQLWPRHPAVWSARLYIFAFTGRANAAMTLIDDRQSRPPGFNADVHRRWQVSLEALDAPNASNIAAARDVILPASQSGFAVQGMMILSMLGALDDAFEVANGFLLRKGPLVGGIRPATGEMQINDHMWRRTMNLFTPATAAMRQDARFAAICDGIGLTEYWQKSGTGPDDFLMKP